MLSAFVAMTAAAVPGSSGTARADTPALIWRDLSQINVLCLAVTENGVDQGRLSRDLCERARAFAADGAPAPVDIVSPGDPAVLAADSLTLLVHVSVRPEAGGRLAAISVRPYRNTADQSGLLFAAAPRAALLAPSDVRGEGLAAPLRAALAETLPWLVVPTGPRPIQP